MIDVPDAAIMAASQTQDDLAGSADSVSHVAPDGVQFNRTASGEVDPGNTESLRREPSLMSVLNKSTSYVDTVFDYSVCSPAPASPQIEETSHIIPALRKASTIDANEIPPLKPVTKSFCARYLDSLAQKSSSKGPKTPMGSPLVSCASSGILTRSKSGIMTPPVSSVCVMASGLLVNSQPEANETVPELTNNPSVNAPVNSTRSLIHPTDEIPTKDKTPEAEAEEEAMETEETNEERETTGMDAKTSGDADTSLVTPPAPILSPVRSLTAAGPMAFPASLPHPGGPAPVQIAFSFDTTGSMSQCIDLVRDQLRDVIQRLLGDVPHLQVAVIAHGDYCDAAEFYMVKSVDFTNDVNVLTQFVNDVGGTGGGDYEECYEYVLNYARGLSWQPGTQRSLVMIGDAIPHEADYFLNAMKLDWKQEADKLLRELVSFVKPYLIKP